MIKNTPKIIIFNLQNFQTLKCNISNISNDILSDNTFHLHLNFFSGRVLDTYTQLYFSRAVSQNFPEKAVTYK